MERKTFLIQVWFWVLSYRSTTRGQHNRGIRVFLRVAWLLSLTSKNVMFMDWPSNYQIALKCLAHFFKGKILLLSKLGRYGWKEYKKKKCSKTSSLYLLRVTFFLFRAFTHLGFYHWILGHHIIQLDKRTTLEINVKFYPSFPIDTVKIIVPLIRVPIECNRKKGVSAVGTRLIRCIESPMWYGTREKYFTFIGSGGSKV